MDYLTKASALARRHIQDHTLDAETEYHWGYAERQVPCLNDPGSCTYLDVVYDSFDVGLIYTGVFWLVLAFLFGVWGLGRLIVTKRTTSTLGRVRNAVAAESRRWLLPDCLVAVFGRTTRLQVLILAVLCSYLTMFTFIGTVYGIWVTPVKDMEGVYNTRTSLGPWANRVGLWAYALTPLSVMLSSRESLLTIITGVPYQHFNFLHRWIGYVILIQSVLHTIGWCVVEIRLYQPQPKVAREWIQQLYMIWGVVALILILALYILSLPFVIRRTGYEFFRKTHYVLAMIYCGACIAHWEKLHCFLTPAIILWFIDRFARLGRTYLIHRRALTKESGGLFHPSQAEATLFQNPLDGDVVRLDFKQRHAAWNIGQHFYLCFMDGSVWQSHPMTPLNAPMCVDGITEHSYVFRAKSGETRKIADVLKAKPEAAERTTPVILTGPYGESLMDSHRENENILCVAGGTGITYVLPVILAMARKGVAPDRKVELIWFVRHRTDIEWIRPELDALETSSISGQLNIRIFTTRDGDITESATNSSLDQPGGVSEKVTDEKVVEAPSPTGSLVRVMPSATVERAGQTRHPDVKPLVEAFVEGTTAGGTTVVASGPGALMSELRRVIAERNSGQKVWTGEDKWDVALQCDDRLEY